MIRLAACALVLVACSSSDKSKTGDGPDSPVGVIAPEPGTDAAVFVRTRIEGGLVVAEIVTRATPALSGAALRVAFPAWLRFDHRDEESGWARSAVHHTKVSPEREVVFVDTVIGKNPGHAEPAAGGESVLTTLYFTHDPQPAQPGALVVVAQRSELRDAAGKPVAVRYYDQAFAP